MSHNLLNILITSASSKTPLVRAMKEAAQKIDSAIGVIAGDINPDIPTRYIADAFWEMPIVSDETLPDIIMGCQIRKISVVLPTRDGELIFWAKHYSLFKEAGITIIISNLQAIRRCLDKLAFAHFGHETGLPMITATDILDTLNAKAYVVKERFGSGSRGVAVNLSAEQAHYYADKLDCPIFQPFINGLEISIDGWLNCHGQCLGVVLRRRDKIESGESQITTTFSNPVLESQAKQILEKLELHGPIVMQAIIIDNVMHIIECNPRFGGASTTGIAAGLDSLYWSLVEAFGVDNTPIFNRIKSEIKLVRMPIDLVLHDSDI